ncbi:MAG TPA: RnfABCDGE type electron transport complex subunit D, partial [Gammaproteobacteria bacterium]|nr:RnfABCDGE type electron transport complex subunit D [Gammaproteobacteria bacterium]
MEFRTAAAPHAAPVTSVPRVMRHVLYALAPAAIVYTWFFGWGLLINFTIAVLFALLTEAAMLKLRGRPLRRSLLDGSALVTAALLSFALPPLLPWWIPALGAFVAICLAKQLYGGLGKNLFNPAMVAYVFLLVSFPIEMTQWIPPRMGDIDYVHLGFLASLDYAFAGRLPAALTLDA